MKSIFSLALCGLIALAASAQDWSYEAYHDGEIYDGFIVMASGDTIQGRCKAQNRVNNQTSVLFITEPDDRKGIKYKAKDGEVVSYQIGGKDYRRMQFSGGLSQKAYNYVLVVQDGAIGTYIHYGIEPVIITSGDLSYDEIQELTYPEELRQTVYWKQGDKPRELSTFAMKFAPKMAELVADYPELSKKVADKEKGYKMLQLDKIIHEYNDWAASR